MLKYVRAQIPNFLKTLGLIDLSVEVNQVGYLVQRYIYIIYIYIYIYIRYIYIYIIYIYIFINSNLSGI